MKKILSLLAILPTLCGDVIAQQPQITIPGVGISLQPNAPVPEGFPDRLLNLVLPLVEVEAEGLHVEGRARAYQLTYAKGGSLITVDRAADGPGTAKGRCRLAIHIERPIAAGIRHQIMIGTDLAEWEIIRRDPPSSDGQPFARTYLLRRHPFDAPVLKLNELRGIAFYNGTWAELGCAPEATENSMIRLTWSLAQRLRQGFQRDIAPIAVTLDDGSRVPTRPDLPDADKRDNKPTRKKTNDRPLLD